MGSLQAEMPEVEVSKVGWGQSITFFPPGLAGRPYPFLIGFPTVTRKFRGDRMDDVNRYLKDGGDFFDR